MDRLYIIIGAQNDDVPGGKYASSEGKQHNSMVDNLNEPNTPTTTSSSSWSSSSPTMNTLQNIRQSILSASSMPGNSQIVCILPQQIPGSRHFSQYQPASSNRKQTVHHERIADRIASIYHLHQKTTVTTGGGGDKNSNLVSASSSSSSSGPVSSTHSTVNPNSGTGNVGITSSSTSSSVHPVVHYVSNPEQYFLQTSPVPFSSSTSSSPSSLFLPTLWNEENELYSENIYSNHHPGGNTMNLSLGLPPEPEHNMVGSDGAQLHSLVMEAAVEQKTVILPCVAPPFSLSSRVFVSALARLKGIATHQTTASPQSTQHRMQTSNASVASNSSVPSNMDNSQYETNPSFSQVYGSVIEDLKLLTPLAHEPLRSLLRNSKEIILAGTGLEGHLGLAILYIHVLMSETYKEECNKVNLENNRRINEAEIQTKALRDSEINKLGKNITGISTTTPRTTKTVTYTTLPQPVRRKIRILKDCCTTKEEQLTGSSLKEMLLTMFQDSFDITINDGWVNVFKSEAKKDENDGTNMTSPVERPNMNTTAKFSADTGKLGTTATTTTSTSLVPHFQSMENKVKQPDNSLSLINNNRKSLRMNTVKEVDENSVKDDSIFDSTVNKNPLMKQKRKSLPSLVSSELLLPFNNGEVLSRNGSSITDRTDTQGTVSSSHEDYSKLPQEGGQLLTLGDTVSADLPEAVLISSRTGTHERSLSYQLKEDLLPLSPSGSVSDPSRVISVIMDGTVIPELPPESKVIIQGESSNSSNTSSSTATADTISLPLATPSKGPADTAVGNNTSTNRDPNPAIPPVVPNAHPQSLVKQKTRDNTTINVPRTTNNNPTFQKAPHLVQLYQSIVGMESNHTAPIHSFIYSKNTHARIMDCGGKLNDLYDRTMSERYACIISKKFPNGLDDTLHSIREQLLNSHAEKSSSMIGNSSKDTTVSVLSTKPVLASTSTVNAMVSSDTSNSIPPVLTNSTVSPPSLPLSTPITVPVTADTKDSITKTPKLRVLSTIAMNAKKLKFPVFSKSEVKVCSCNTSVVLLAASRGYDDVLNVLLPDYSKLSSGKRENITKFSKSKGPLLAFDYGLPEAKLWDAIYAPDGLLTEKENSLTTNNNSRSNANTNTTVDKTATGTVNNSNNTTTKVPSVVACSSHGFRMTPLMWACARGSETAVSILLAALEETAPCPCNLIHALLMRNSFGADALSLACSSTQLTPPSYIHPKSRNSTTNPSSTNTNATTGGPSTPFKGTNNSKPNSNAYPPSIVIANKLFHALQTAVEKLCTTNSSKNMSEYVVPNNRSSLPCNCSTLRNEAERITAAAWAFGDLEDIVETYLRSTNTRNHSIIRNSAGSLRIPVPYCPPEGPNVITQHSGHMHNTTKLGGSSVHALKNNTSQGNTTTGKEKETKGTLINTNPTDISIIVKNDTSGGVGLASSSSSSISSTSATEASVALASSSITPVRSNTLSAISPVTLTKSTTVFGGFFINLIATPIEICARSGTLKPLLLSLGSSLAYSEIHEAIDKTIVIATLHRALSLAVWNGHWESATAAICVLNILKVPIMDPYPYPVGVGFFPLTTTTEPSNPSSSIIVTNPLLKTVVNKTTLIPKGVRMVSTVRHIYLADLPILQWNIRLAACVLGFNGAINSVSYGSSTNRIETKQSSVPTEYLHSEIMVPLSVSEGKFRPSPTVEQSFRYFILTYRLCLLGPQFESHTLETQTNSKTQRRKTIGMFYDAINVNSSNSLALSKPLPSTKPESHNKKIFSFSSNAPSNLTLRSPLTIQPPNASLPLNPVAENSANKPSTVFSFTDLMNTPEIKKFSNELQNGIKKFSSLSSVNPIELVIQRALLLACQSLSFYTQQKIDGRIVDERLDDDKDTDSDEGIFDKTNPYKTYANPFIFSSPLSLASHDGVPGHVNSFMPRMDASFDYTRALGSQGWSTTTAMSFLYPQSKPELTVSGTVPPLGPHTVGYEFLQTEQGIKKSVRHKFSLELLLQLLTTIQYLRTCYSLPLNGHGVGGADTCTNLLKAYPDILDQPNTGTLPWLLVYECQTCRRRICAVCVDRCHNCSLINCGACNIEPCPDETVAENSIYGFRGGNKVHQHRTTGNSLISKPVSSYGPVVTKFTSSTETVLTSAAVKSSAMGRSSSIMPTFEIPRSSSLLATGNSNEEVATNGTIMNEASLKLLKEGTVGGPGSGFPFPGHHDIICIGLVPNFRCECEDGSGCCNAVSPWATVLIEQRGLLYRPTMYADWYLKQEFKEPISITIENDDNDNITGLGNDEDNASNANDETNNDDRNLLQDSTTHHRSGKSKRKNRKTNRNNDPNRGGRRDIYDDDFTGTGNDYSDPDGNDDDEENDDDEDDNDDDDDDDNDDDEEDDDDGENDDSFSDGDNTNENTLGSSVLNPTDSATGLSTTNLSPNLSSVRARADTVQSLRSATLYNGNTNTIDNSSHLRSASTMPKSKINQSSNNRYRKIKRQKKGSKKQKNNQQPIFRRLTSKDAHDSLIHMVARYYHLAWWMHRRSTLWEYNAHPSMNAKQSKMLIVWDRLTTAEQMEFETIVLRLLQSLRVQGWKFQWTLNALDNRNSSIQRTSSNLGPVPDPVVLNGFQKLENLYKGYLQSVPEPYDPYSGQFDPATLPQPEPLSHPLKDQLIKEAAIILHDRKCAERMIPGAKNTTHNPSVHPSLASTSSLHQHSPLWAYWPEHRDERSKSLLPLGLLSSSAQPKGRFSCAEAVINILLYAGVEIKDKPPVPTDATGTNSRNLQTPSRTTLGSPREQIFRSLSIPVSPGPKDTILGSPTGNNPNYYPSTSTPGAIMDRAAIFELSFLNHLKAPNSTDKKSGEVTREGNTVNQPEKANENGKNNNPTKDSSTMSKTRSFTNRIQGKSYKNMNGSTSLVPVPIDISGPNAGIQKTENSLHVYSKALLLSLLIAGIGSDDEKLTKASINQLQKLLQQPLIMHDPMDEEITGFRSTVSFIEDAQKISWMRSMGSKSDIYPIVYRDTPLLSAIRQRRLNAAKALLTTLEQASTLSMNTSIAPNMVTSLSNGKDGAQSIGNVSNPVASNPIEVLNTSVPLTLLPLSLAAHLGLSELCQRLITLGANPWVPDQSLDATQIIDFGTSIVRNPNSSLSIGLPLFTIVSSNTYALDTLSKIGRNNSSVPSTVSVNKNTNDLLTSDRKRDHLPYALSPLHYASLGGNVHIINLFLAANDNLLLSTLKKLHSSSGSGNSRTSNRGPFFLSSRSKVRAKTLALSIAVHRAHDLVVRSILDHYTDPLVEDGFNSCPYFRCLLLGIKDHGNNPPEDMDTDTDSHYNIVDNNRQITPRSYTANGARSNYYTERSTHPKNYNDNVDIPVNGPLSPVRSVRPTPSVVPNISVPSGKQKYRDTDSQNLEDNNTIDSDHPEKDRSRHSLYRENSGTHPGWLSVDSMHGDDHFPPSKPNKHRNLNSIISVLSKQDSVTNMLSWFAAAVAFTLLITQIGFVLLFIYASVANPNVPMSTLGMYKTYIETATQQSLEASVTDACSWYGWLAANLCRDRTMSNSSNMNNNNNSINGTNCIDTLLGIPPVLGCNLTAAAEKVSHTPGGILFGVARLGSEPPVYPTIFTLGSSLFVGALKWTVYQPIDMHLRAASRRDCIPYEANDLSSSHPGTNVLSPFTDPYAVNNVPEMVYSNNYCPVFDTHTNYDMFGEGSMVWTADTSSNSYQTTNTIINSLTTVAANEISTALKQLFQQGSESLTYVTSNSLDIALHQPSLNVLASLHIETSFPPFGAASSVVSGRLANVSGTPFSLTGFTGYIIMLLVFLSNALSLALSCFSTRSSQSLRSKQYSSRSLTIPSSSSGGNPSSSSTSGNKSSRSVPWRVVDGLVAILCIAIIITRIVSWVQWDLSSTWNPSMVHRSEYIDAWSLLRNFQMESDFSAVLLLFAISRMIEYLERAPLNIGITLRSIINTWLHRRTLLYLVVMLALTGTFAISYFVAFGPSGSGYSSISQTFFALYTVGFFQSAFSFKGSDARPVLTLFQLLWPVTFVVFINGFIAVIADVYTEQEKRAKKQWASGVIGQLQEALQLGEEPRVKNFRRNMTKFFTCGKRLRLQVFYDLFLRIRRLVRYCCGRRKEGGYSKSDYNYPPLSLSSYNNNNNTSPTNMMGSPAGVSSFTGESFTDISNAAYAHRGIGTRALSLAVIFVFHPTVQLWNCCRRRNSNEHNNNSNSNTSSGTNERKNSLSITPPIDTSNRTASTIPGTTTVPDDDETEEESGNWEGLHELETVLLTMEKTSGGGRGNYHH